MKNITHKELKQRGFNYKSNYGVCPIYERDGFGYLFKERGVKLEQIMNAYQDEVNLQNKPIGYLKERLSLIDDGYEMGLNQLPFYFEFMKDIDKNLSWEGTKLYIDREIESEKE